MVKLTRKNKYKSKTANKYGGTKNESQVPSTTGNIENPQYKQVFQNITIDENHFVDVSYISNHFNVVSIKNSDFSNCSFIDCTFNNCFLERNIFNNCIFDKCIFFTCNGIYNAFEQSNLIILLEDCDINEISFKECNDTIPVLNNLPENFTRDIDVFMDKNLIKNSKIFNLSITSRSSFTEFSFLTSHICRMLVDESKLNKCVFSDSLILNYWFTLSSELEFSYINACRFVNGQFYGIGMYSKWLQNEFINGQFDSAQLSGSEWIGNNFSRIFLNNVDLEECRIQLNSFSACEVHNADFTNAENLDYNTGLSFLGSLNVPIKDPVPIPETIKTNCNNETCAISFDEINTMDNLNIVYMKLLNANNISYDCFSRDSIIQYLLGFLDNNGRIRYIVRPGPNYNNNNNDLIIESPFQNPLNREKITKNFFIQNGGFHPLFANGSVWEPDSPESNINNILEDYLVPDNIPTEEEMNEILDEEI